MATRLQYPSYDPAISRVKLDDGKNSFICNSHTSLDRLTRTRLISQAKRRFSTADRNTLQFAADLRRLHDSRVHKTGTGSQDFTVWAAGTFEGLTKGSANMLCWQGGLLIILEGHGLIDLSAPKLRIGARAVRKLASLFSHFDEDTLLTVWHQMEQDKPDGKLTEADVVAAMQDSGVFILNSNQPQDGDDEDEEERPDEVTVRLNRHTDHEDFSDAPANEDPDADEPDIEAILHLHQELVDPFDKLRRELVKLTDPDNQPYDIEAIRQRFNEAVDLLLDLGDLLQDPQDDQEAA